MYLQSFSDSFSVPVANVCEKFAVWPDYVMITNLCMIESLTTFTNVNFKAFTRDAVNTWVVVRRSSVLLCIKNRFELVFRVTTWCYIDSVENALNVVWCTSNEGENKTCSSFQWMITSFQWLGVDLVGGITIGFKVSHAVVFTFALQAVLLE